MPGQIAIVALASVVQLLRYLAVVAGVALLVWISTLPFSDEWIPFWPIFGLSLAGFSTWISYADRHWEPVWNQVTWFRLRTKERVKKSLNHKLLRILCHLIAMGAGVILMLPLLSIF